ncbi:MAG: hypothetical protein Athens071425_100 [Parcubacteria group bacterium Athens0714_25]|nr:MAG: hypothetical protein Athens071425_100 [Parcubacteria group bacterium Athens0714_25]
MKTVVRAVLLCALLENVRECREWMFFLPLARKRRVLSLLGNNIFFHII